MNTNRDWTDAPEQLKQIEADVKAAVEKGNANLLAEDELRLKNLQMFNITTDELQNIINAIIECTDSDFSEEEISSIVKHPFVPGACYVTLTDDSEYNVYDHYTTAMYSLYMNHGYDKDDLIPRVVRKDSNGLFFSISDLSDLDPEGTMFEEATFNEKPPVVASIIEGSIVYIVANEEGGQRDGYLAQFIVGDTTGKCFSAIERFT